MSDGSVAPHSARYVGIELDTTEGYFPIARARIAHWAELAAARDAELATGELDASRGQAA